MKHELECLALKNPELGCICVELSAAYRRGYAASERGETIVTISIPKIVYKTVELEYFCFVDDEEGVPCCYEGLAPYTWEVDAATNKALGPALIMCPECGEEGEDESAGDDQPWLW